MIERQVQADSLQEGTEQGQERVEVAEMTRREGQACEGRQGFEAGCVWPEDHQGQRQLGQPRVAVKKVSHDHVERKGEHILDRGHDSRSGPLYRMDYTGRKFASAG